MRQSCKLAQVGKECVACGCCVAVCPRSALHIAAGVVARVDEDLCVGCGKCERTCPAAVITITDRGCAQ